jgi:C-terminal processing protease CtpA/Prc
MKRTWMFGLAGALVLAGSTAPRVARASYEEQDQARKDDETKKPGRRFEVRRMLGGGGRLGISIEDASAGVTVTDVHDDSAASKAGVREGDVVVRFAGENVRSAAQLSRLVRETPAGRPVDIEVTRGGSAQKLSTTLQEPDRDRLFTFRPGGGEDFHFEMPDMPDMPDLPEIPDVAELADVPEPPAPPAPPRIARFFMGQGRKLGLSYQELGDQLAGYFKVEGGVLVTHVEEDGPAAKAGIKAGDVIVRVGGNAIKNGGDLREAIRDADAGSKAAVVVQREGRSVDLSVTVGEAEGARLAPGSTRSRRRGART